MSPEKIAACRKPLPTLKRQLQPKRACKPRHDSRRPVISTNTSSRLASLLWMVSTWWLRSSAWNAGVVGQAVHVETRRSRDAPLSPRYSTRTQPLAARDLQLGGRVQRDDPPVDDEGHPVAQLVGGRHVVGGQKDRAAARLQVQDRCS